MPAVSVVIPNLNGRHLLPMCLDTLRMQTFKDFEVIVVDNGSSDGSIELLKEKYPEAVIIALDKNYGFAYPVNRGIEAARGEFVCLLNNDIELDVHWMEELLGALRRHPEAGSCGPKLMRLEERERINVLGIRMNSDSGVEIIGAGHYDRGQYDEARYVFGVNAGASMYRKSMFDRIGFFDELFFASYEDVDIAFRAQLAGFKALYEPKALGYHMVGATIKRRRYRPTYLNNRNSVIFFLKDMPGDLIKKNFWKIFRLRTGYFLKRVIMNFWKIRTFYYVRGTLGAFLRLPSILRSRKKVQATICVTAEYLESIMDRDFI